MPKKYTSKKNQTSLKKIVVFSVLTLFIILSFLFIYQNKDYILYYLSYKTKHKTLSPNEQKAHDKHINKIIENHSSHTFGIDVSQYQGIINWNEVKTLNNKHTIEFVIVRATAGKNKVDATFNHNWNKIESKFIRGAYHYYRPNENSIEQAQNFIKTVKLSKGDLPPILDIEKLPKTQSIDSLKVGLKRWLEKVEKHYKMKPIIYSGESYYNDFLKDEFSNYPFWIANYNFWKKEIEDEWIIWQFSENATINGINGAVDLNVFKGKKSDLIQLCLK